MNISDGKFNIIDELKITGGDSIYLVNATDIRTCLSHLKNSPEYSRDMLISITAVDLIDNIKLIYHLFSSELYDHTYISVLTDVNKPAVDSVTSIYKSAAYDEREIFDLFGVSFNDHPGLKRILMPNSMKGHPLRKNYNPKDERLAWNE